MLRKLVDYKKLDLGTAALLIETYPHGYGDEDIISFKNINGEVIEAVQIKTKDTIYMVKISKCLANFISNFDDIMEKELEEKESFAENDMEESIPEGEYDGNMEGEDLLD